MKYKNFLVNVNFHNQNSLLGNKLFMIANVYLTYFKLNFCWQRSHSRIADLPLQCNSNYVGYNLFFGASEAIGYTLWLTCRGMRNAMSDLEVQLRNSLAALDDLKESFEQQRLVWQQECEGIRMQLEQARQREAALLLKNEQLTRKLVEMGSLPENNPLLKQFKMVGAHIEALAQEATAFNNYISSVSTPESH